MNVAALLQETPSEDVSARRARSGSTAGGNSTGGPPPSQPSSLDRERDRDLWGRGRPAPPSIPPPANAGLRSIVHSPVDSRSNAPDSYRTGPPPHIQSSPSSSMHPRGQAPLSPALSMKDPKIPANANTSPSMSRASGLPAYGGPHGHPHSSHPSPAMGSLRPNAALASGSTNSVSASQTSANSGIGGGEARPSSATGWPGPGYGGPGRERRGSASSGIGVGGGLLRSNQPHPPHSASPVFEKDYPPSQQQQPGARRKTISSGSGSLLGGGSAANSNIMPPPSQLVGPGTGTPPDDLPPLSHKSSSMAPPMSHPSALPPSMHGPPPPATHQHSMSSSSFMERERDILLNREPRDHPMDHLRPSSSPAGPSASNPSGTSRQFHSSHTLPPSVPTGPRAGPHTSYSQPGSGRVTPINDLERDRERERIMYDREREHQRQRERTLSSASASGGLGPSPLTSPRGVPYGPPPPPGHHSSQSVPPPPGSGQSGSPRGGPGQSPHIHPASGASHAPPANPYAAASGGFGHSPYGPPPSSGGAHGPPHPSSSSGSLPPSGPASAREREREREYEQRERERARFGPDRDRDRDLRDREYGRDRDLRDREQLRDRELRERELRDREREFREREVRERERDMREREVRERERERDAVMRDVRPDPRDLRGPPGGRPDPRDLRGEPRDVRGDHRDFRAEPRADPYHERDLRVDHRDRERRDIRERDYEWERKERDRAEWDRLEKAQREEERERERREREQREHREQANRERDLKEREAREKEAREREKEQIMIMREKQREKDLRDRERQLRERELQQMREREGEGREGGSRNATIIIGPGVVPPPAPSMQREAPRASAPQPPPATPSTGPPGPHPPQSHHQGRFNTAFISNFAGPNERGSRNNSRVSSPNPATIGSQMSTISMSVGPMPTIGPGVPGPSNSSVGGMHIIPGGMLGGGLPSQMNPGSSEPKGRIAPTIAPDRRERDARDTADSKEGIRERERERERDHDRDIKPAPIQVIPPSSNPRAPGPSAKDQPPQPPVRDRERERERERELYAAAIAGGPNPIPPPNSGGRRHVEGEHHGHSRHPSLSQQQQQQQQQQQHQRERERERDRERERETRRHQAPYPHPYDDIPNPRDRERERERPNIVNPGQVPPMGRDGDVEMGYGYPPPHHPMGPPPPPGWNEVPGGPTPMEMGYPPGPPGPHHPMHHHPAGPSQSFVGYHPPPPGPYPVGGQPPPGYGPSPPPGQPGYGQPHPQYGYDDRGMPAPVDANGIHHGTNGVVVVPGGSVMISHSIPPGPPSQPQHPPQHLYSVPPGYMPMQVSAGIVHPGAQPGSGLQLPASTLTLTASSPLESPDEQLDVVRAAEAAAVFQAEQEREYERKPLFKAKTTINLGTFVYPDLPFPYKFDLGGGISTDRKVIVQETPEKRPAVTVKEGKATAKDSKLVKGKEGGRVEGVEEGEIAEAAQGSAKEKAPSPVVKEEPSSARTTKISVVDLVSDETPPRPSARDTPTILESNLDAATKVDDVEIEVETRVTVVIPHGHLPDERPTRPKIWGGGVAPISPIGSSSKAGPSHANGRTNEPSTSRVPKTITRDSLVPLLPLTPDTPAPQREERQAYLAKLDDVGQTILRKYTPRRIYTDDSDLALCAIHSGWVSWDGVREAKLKSRDLRVEIKVMRVARLGADGQWSSREIGKLVEVQSYGKEGKASAADKERREEVVTRFIGGLGERCWSAKGRHGWIEVGEDNTTIEEDPLNDGRALMSAAWGTGHDGAAIEVLSAVFVERGTSRKAPGLGRRNRAQRMLEYAERRMAVLGQSPQQQHPLLRTIAKGNVNPRVVSSLTLGPWNFTTTALAGRKRRRGYGCINAHPPINAKLPNSTLLEAISELDELEKEKTSRGAKRPRTGSLSEVVRLPGKTQEEWREDTLMNLKTVVFATHTVPPPVTAEDSYPTSPTSPAGPNPITAGLLTAGGSSKRDSTTGESVRVGYKYDRKVLKQMLFPSDPLPPASNSLKTSPAIDKEKALLSQFLGSLPRRQVILETATKERYLLAPKRADGSPTITIPDARKVLWAYDISLILEQEVIVEDVKEDPIVTALGDLVDDVPVSPDDASAPTTLDIPLVVEPPQDSPQTANEEKKPDAPLPQMDEKEEGELESNDPAEEPAKVPEPAHPAQDKDGDVEMGDGDKEPGELNEDEENTGVPEKAHEEPKIPAISAPTAAPSPHPPILKLDTINLTPSKAPSRIHSKLNSPVNPRSSVAPSVVGPDLSMDIGDEDTGDDSFVTLIRGEDEDGNEQSVHYPVQMLQRHVTEGMLRFEEEGIYVKEASFVGPTVPPSPTASVSGEADGERMDIIERGPGGLPTEWRMQVVSWKWAGPAWGGF